MDEYCLKKDSKELIIKIEHKKVKNYNLRILPNNIIKCSVPLNSSDDEVLSFIKDKENWLYNNINQINNLVIPNKDILKNGGSVKILGHYYAVKVQKFSQNLIEIKDKYITIFVKGEKTNIESIYRKYLKNEMGKHFQNLIDKFFPIIRKYGKKKPELKIRKMSKCWGTSNPKNNSITLNEILYMTHPYCIEYIVLHEITHFLYPYHNKQFYDFISVYMPDWKERRKVLNLEFGD